MKYSVRVTQGTHDTIWDKVDFLPNGWLHVWNHRPATASEGEESIRSGRGRFFNVIEDERWYPPTSVYSVKPVRD